MGRCWAFNADGQRCDMDTEHHLDLHSFTITWTDAETISPTGGTTVHVPTVIHTANGKTRYPPQDNDPPDSCFSCGCTDNEHGDNGCEPHGCYTYVPG